MKRFSALIGSIVCIIFITIAVASAEENSSAVPASNVELLVNLLKGRNVISEEEAASVIKQPVSGNNQETINALLNLLYSKGVINVEEAAGLADDDSPAASPKKVTGPAGRNTATVPLILPMDDRRFIKILKDKWLEIGRKIEDFYPAFDDSRDPEYIIGRMKELEVITDDEAYELTRQYRGNYFSGAVSATLENKEKSYLERISKGVEAELDKNILAKIRNDWPQRIKLSGDVRLRYEGDFFDSGNGEFIKPDDTSQLMNSKINRNRFAIRARLGLEAKVSDEVTAGIGLATGSADNPVSTNSTMGDSLNKKSFVLDRAYLRWDPASSLSVWGGRFPNPWFYSDLVWDQDINFEGVAIQYRPRLNSSWGLFFNCGVFPLQEVELSGKDKWLFGAQAGFEYTIKDKLTARLGAALYMFENTVGVTNDPTGPGETDWTAPLFQQKGNTLLDIDPSSTNIKTAYASKFKELNITGTIDLDYWHPVHIVLLGDYVNNLGFDKSPVSARNGTDIKKETEGYQFGLSAGSLKMHKLYDWKALFYYKYIEADAVMDAFTDSSFHLGGTNAKGWIIGGDLGIANNTWISTRWFSSNEISGPPLSIDVLQFDINARY